MMYSFQVKGKGSTTKATIQCKARQTDLQEQVEMSELQAQGNYIAQANHGSTASVTHIEHYHESTKPYIPLQRPPQVEHFTGREKEIAKLLKDLQPGRRVTLCGPGGIGKSALASQAIWELSPDNKPSSKFPDGIIWHDFYEEPQSMKALENIALSFKENPRP